MATPIVEVDEYTANVVAPEGGDVRNAASVRTPLQALANRTKYMADRLIGEETVTFEAVDPARWVRTGPDMNVYPSYDLAFGLYYFTGGVGTIYMSLAHAVPRDATLTAIKVKYQTNNSYVSNDTYLNVGTGLFDPSLGSLGLAKSTTVTEATLTLAPLAVSRQDAALKYMMLSLNAAGGKTLSLFKTSISYTFARVTP